MKLHRVAALSTLLLGFGLLTAQADDPDPPPQAVVSAMVFKTPSQSGSTVTVPVELTLGTTDTSFTSFGVVVEYYGAAGLLIEGTIIPQIPVYTPPNPGQKVIVNITFTAKSGRWHKISGSMIYKDGASKDQEYVATPINFNAK
jgi:hypothetical protein